MFYYPANPSKMRDDRCIEILSYFTKAMVLGEKPSHGNHADAITFKNSLLEKNIDLNRVVIGMHGPLHPSRIAIQKFVEENKDYVTKVEAYNHYPKDPTDGYNRCYDPAYGGAYLDLGVYVYQ